MTFNSISFLNILRNTSPVLLWERGILRETLPETVVGDLSLEYDLSSNPESAKYWRWDLRQMVLRF